MQFLKLFGALLVHFPNTWWSPGFRLAVEWYRENKAITSECARFKISQEPGNRFSFAISHALSTDSGQFIALATTDEVESIAAFCLHVNEHVDEQNNNVDVQQLLDSLKVSRIC